MRSLSKRLSFILLLIFLGSAALIACTGAPAPVAAPATQPSAATFVPPSQTASPAPTATTGPTPLPSPTPVTETVLKISQNAELGMVLTDAQGMTLYLFKNDQPEQSNCTGGCLALWPPLTISQGVALAEVPGLAGNIGVIELAGGKYQVTYNDSPLYRYSKDAKPGDATGDGFNGLWSAVVLPPPAAEPTPASGVAIDWTKSGFPTTLSTQDITPDNAATISAGPYTVYVPAGTFEVAVKLVLLSGDPTTFRDKAPRGQIPVLAFAFDAWDAKTNQLIGTFNQPMVLTARDSHIVADSGYYNLDSSGNYSLNMTGVQVASGELTHPIAGASVAWVITVPASAAAVPTSAGK